MKTWASCIPSVDEITSHKDPHPISTSRPRITGGSISVKSNDVFDAEIQADVTGISRSEPWMLLEIEHFPVAKIVM